MDGAAAARVVIEQRSDTAFLLREGFRYQDDPTGMDFLVLPADLPVTDLASVPWYLRWFVPAYGRHSLAALLHDHLLENGHRLTPPIARVMADEIFLRALADLDVPRVRRNLMGAAVNIQTRLDRGGSSRLRMRVWLASSLLGTATLLSAVLSGEPLLALGAILAPLLGALLWWPQLRLGMVAGYGTAILGPPAVVVAGAYGFYWLSELALGAVLGDSEEARDAQVGRPGRDL